ncbi:hypothetical protein GIB67_002077 [Kingdonia uniflora]|uniref:Peroxidase n=1 Tax=Kingdonia uniflora TaxID=39325 RepID=A0A7J7KWE5_9MAGN|nr:hypothetical protein GIB67_002077 [Kingdonia uniflora]
MWSSTQRFALLLLTVSLILSLGNFRNQLQEEDLVSDSLWIHPVSLSTKQHQKLSYSRNPSFTTLEYDFYRDTCPKAEEIVRNVVRELYESRSNVSPVLLRLLFHDCFVMGCDASILLDSVDGDHSEKDVSPNETLKGFDLIEIIKSKIEEVCPGKVSCADILVLAARESLVLAGGPFYPLTTGRRDSMVAFPQVASNGLPSPHDDLYTTLMTFANRGFSERETVSILGAHGIGVIHCRFFRNRLYNFGGSGLPDPSVESEFLKLMRSKCSRRSKGSHHLEGPGMEMNSTESSFAGALYYQNLMQGRGILRVDQQLMSSEGTAGWVRAYASDNPNDMQFALVLSVVFGQIDIGGDEGVTETAVPDKCIVPEFIARQVAGPDQSDAAANPGSRNERNRLQYY